MIYENLIYVFCSFMLSWAIVKILSSSREHKLKTQLESAQIIAKKMIINVKIEKHGDMFYLFDKNNDNFIAQGKDLTELNQRFNERFKHNIIFADPEEIKLYGLK